MDIQWEEGIRNQLDLLEGILRDTAFNRGPAGAIKRLQEALNKTMDTNLSVDGGMGYKSRKTLMNLLSSNPPKGHENNGDYWLEVLLANYKIVSQSFEEETKRDNLIKGMSKRAGSICARNFT